jgi:hypothetical protein
MAVAVENVLPRNIVFLNLYVQTERVSVAQFIFSYLSCNLIALSLCGDAMAHIVARQTKRMVTGLNFESAISHLYGFQIPNTCPTKTLECSLLTLCQVERHR